MTVLGLERIRVSYEQGNRPALWLLLALLVFVVAARHLPPLFLVGRLNDVILTPSDVLTGMPVLLAAATALVASGRRLLLAGASLVAAATVLSSIGRLAPLLSSDVTLSLNILAAPLLVAGLLLFGHGLGGVRSPLGVTIVFAGLVMALLAAALAIAWGLPLLGAGGIGPALLASSAIQQFTYLGWAYVLAAAVERRARLIATGAGLLILLPVAELALGEFARRQQPGFEMPVAGMVFLVLSLAAWAALIVGIIREVDDPATGPLAR